MSISLGTVSELTKGFVPPAVQFDSQEKINQGALVRYTSSP